MRERLMTQRINIGSSFGNYRVDSKIGEGGMGEVYRAKDPTIGRDVAIKVLPAELSADPDRLRRFELEAQTAGSLNHPNILVIYHVGTENGAPYIVSELLEGETLRDKINGSPLSQRKALDYALQTARGLAAAHEKGIVHRDLKPENLFVTKDGRVKILDFGLAKLTHAQDTDGHTDLPTRKLNTEPGTVMGTVAYMSPEQVRARPVDHRSDIFSFGVILYEMLTGTTAFRGDSTADLMSAILREEPPSISAVNPAVPLALERVIEHCLEKSPDERFRSASDLAFAIEALSGTTVSSGAVQAGRVHTPLRLRRILPWALAGLLLLTSAAFAWLYFSTPPKANDQIRFIVPAPEKTEDASTPIISPDGRTLAFLANLEGKRGLYVRTLDNAMPRRLPGTDDASFPFWSPDSRYIAFFAESKLKKVDLQSDSVQVICDARSGSGGSWNRGGTIVFGMFDHGIHRVSAAGGQASPLLSVDKENKEIDHSFPAFLPDGDHFLYFCWRGVPTNSQVWAASLDGKTRKLVLENNSNVGYADGHILFSRAATLMAQKFDTRSLTLEGEPFPVAENVMFSGAVSYSNFSVSSNGVLAHSAGGDLTRQLRWFDRTGKDLGLIDPAGAYNDLALSPDDRWIVTQRLDVETGNLWIFDTSRNVTSRFTLTVKDADDPVWTRDGKYIVFTGVLNGSKGIFRKAPAGAGPEELLVVLKEWAGGGNGMSLSPDGRFVLLDRVGQENYSDLWIIPTDGSSPYPFANTGYNEFQGTFSPDGKWVAYVSGESGRSEVYVRSFPEDTGKFQVSTGGGGQPRWSRDGRELFYIDQNKQLMFVRITSAGTFEMSAPAPLFRTEVSSYVLPNRFDISSDGKRFLVNSSTNYGTPTPIIVVTNWSAGIKR